MYTIEEFDKEKTKVLRYILYKKRSEYEIRNKFNKILDNNLLEDIIEYLKEANYINDKGYIEKTINNFIALKNLCIKEIKYKLIAKGLNKSDIEDYICENKEELEKGYTPSKELIEKLKESPDQAQNILSDYKSENIEIALDTF